MTHYSEIALATLGVRDLAATQRFYEQVFGYVEMATGDVPLECATAWRMPAGLRGRFVVLGRAGTTRGLLRLVQFDAPGEHIWGRYERLQDHGHYAINIRVPDVHASWAALTSAGVRPKSAPTHWHVDETMAAWDSQCWDPDGTLLDVYQMEGREEIFPPLDCRGSALETVAIHVESADRSRDFYMGLGFALFFDRTIEGLGHFFHLPGDVALRDVNLYKPELSRVGRIEIVELVGFPGRPVRDRACPPMLGPLSMSFVTDDADAARRDVERLGGELLGDEYRTDAPVFGPARAFGAFGPDGELLEFLQPEN